MKGGLIQTKCLINHHPIKAILDTGSAYTIIKEAVLLNQNLHHLIIPTNNFNIYTANGTKTNLKGMANIILTFNNIDFKVKTIVVQDLNIDCIIGLDILKVNPSTKRATRKYLKAASCSFMKQPSSDSSSEESNSIGSEDNVTKKETCRLQNEEIVASNSLVESKPVQISQESNDIISETIQVQSNEIKLKEFQVENKANIINQELYSNEIKEYSNWIPKRSLKAELNLLKNRLSESNFKKKDYNLCCSIFLDQHTKEFKDMDMVITTPKKKYVFNKESPEVQKIIEQIKESIQDISADDLKNVKPTDLYKHTIELVSQVPFQEKMRPIPQAKKLEFKQMIQDMLSNGMIVESKSPYSSATRLVKKPDGTIRITIDYRMLNELTVKDNYPLPLISDVLNALARAVIYSTLDLTSGYHQVSLDEMSRKYTAFRCEFGFFEYTVMPMGLCNAGSTFQRMVEHVLRDLIGKCCMVYQDDIIIFSNSVEEHQEHLQMVFERIRLAKLWLKLKKCKFFESNIKYLGYIVENGTIRPDPQKVKALYEYERPKTMKQLLGFLGLSNYFRRFIRDYAVIASPLLKLTKKDSNFIWTNECQQSYEKIRKYLTTEGDVLALPNVDKTFIVECDASDYGVGGVLLQEQEDGKRRPISYFSKHMSKAEMNYSVSERELLSIVLNIEHNRHYLYGREFVVSTDHQPLKWLLTVKDPASRLARWIIRLEEYTFRIHYKKGKSNGGADGLSRWPLPDDKDEESNKDIIICFIVVQIIKMSDHMLTYNVDELKPPKSTDLDQYENDNIEFHHHEKKVNINLLVCKKLSTNESELNEDIEIDKIESVSQNEISVNAIMFRNINTTTDQRSDEDLKWIMTLLEQYDVRPNDVRGNNDEQKRLLSQFNTFRINENKLWRQNLNSSNEKSYQYVVPKSQRVEIMKYLHCSVVGAHLMYDKIVNNLTDRFYWPTMRMDLREFIKNCDLCQKTTHAKHKQIAHLQPILPIRPLELVTSDIMGPLKETPRKNKYVLSIIDHFTKFVQLYAIENIEAKTVAQQFVKYIASTGMPENILSDQGTQYESQLFEELCAILDVNRLHTTSYHKECDGISERLFRTIQKMLKCLVNANHDDWDNLLPLVSIAYNSCVHATTNFPPYELMFGRRMKLPLDMIFKQPDIEVPVNINEYAFKVRENSRQMFEVATQNRNKRMAIIKTCYDRKVTAAPFEIDDLVLVLNQYLEKDQCKKFKYNYRGPYVVKAILNKVDYILAPRGGGKRITVHRNNLKKYYQRELTSGLPIDTVVDELVSSNSKPPSKRINNKRKYVKNPKCPRWKRLNNNIASKVIHRLNKRKGLYTSSVGEVGIDELIAAGKLTIKPSRPKAILETNKLNVNNVNSPNEMHDLDINQASAIQQNISVQFRLDNVSEQVQSKRVYRKRIFSKVIRPQRERRQPQRINVESFAPKSYYNN